jgi:predicted DNA binding CopG/RHH family protein
VIGTDDMAKKKTKKSKLPARGASDRDVADFWDTHSLADFWDELSPAELSVERGPRRVVTLRLDSGALEALRALAKRRGIEYSTLARTWISERPRSELCTARRR